MASAYMAINKHTDIAACAHYTLRARPRLGTTPLFSASLLVLLPVGQSIPGVLVAELCVLPDWH
eukprot:6359694-Alexandrium_andersonii.AAC.1